MWGGGNAAWPAWMGAAGSHIPCWQPVPHHHPCSLLQQLSVVWAWAVQPCMHGRMDKRRATPQGGGRARGYPAAGQAGRLGMRAKAGCASCWLRAVHGMHATTYARGHAAYRKTSRAGGTMHNGCTGMHVRQQVEASPACACMHAVNTPTPCHPPLPFHTFRRRCLPMRRRRPSGAAWRRPGPCTRRWVGGRAGWCARALVVWCAPFHLSASPAALLVSVCLSRHAPHPCLPPAPPPPTHTRTPAHAHRHTKAGPPPPPPRPGPLGPAGPSRLPQPGPHLAAGGAAREGARQPRGAGRAAQEGGHLLPAGAGPLARSLAGKPMQL